MSSVVHVVPHAALLKSDPRYVRIWRCEYQWKSELKGWQKAKSFCFESREENTDLTKLTDKARILADCRAPRGAIGIEITSVKLFSPIANKEGD